MNRYPTIILSLAFIAAIANAPCANAFGRTLRDDHAVNVDKEKAKKAEPLSVAIFNFDADAPGNPKLGSQIAEIIGIKLSDNPGFKLVNRTEMKKILGEQELTKAGADQTVARQDGKLVGAELIIIGKNWVSGGKMYLTTYLIGTATTLQHGEMVIGDLNSDPMDLAVKISDRLATAITDRGPGLIAQVNPAVDPLIALNHALAGRKLPKVAVQIHEQHVAVNPPLHTDPAAETETRKLLKDAGFTVIEGDDKALTAAGVTLVITGDGFSEFADRIGKQIICTARLEIKIKDRTTGEVLFSDSVTTRDVDLAENTAAKAALQKAGHALGIEILGQFEKTLPVEKAPK